MDYFTQPKAPSRDNITPLSAAPNTASSIGTYVSLRPGSAQGQHDRPQTALRPSSIRIRRLPSTPQVPQINVEETEDGNAVGQSEGVGRRRSSSEPQRTHLSLRPPTGLARQRTGGSYMQSVREETSEPGIQSPEPSTQIPTTPGRMRRASTSARSALGLETAGSKLRPTSSRPIREYETGVVDFLDVVDPEVATLSTLTNVQNSLFVPDLGRFLNRQPTYELTKRPPAITEGHTSSTDIDALSRIITSREKEDQENDEARVASQRALTRSHSITSILSETNYAVLPHAVSLDGWSEEDKAELNDYVRHMLHSRRSRFKRGLRGFGKYLQKPLGFFVTLYAVLITLFGLAWVLFLIGWIYVGERQPYIINVIDNVLVALFALNGDFLAPFRARDTYHMIFIAHYHHLTWRLRREKALPKLKNENDLPVKFSKEHDVESALDDKHETSVLSPKQEARLRYHQNKFARSHSFYKPHETITHTAFPLRLLVAVVVLLDFHSCFQIALGACTWGISYHVRPQALTAVILSLSISCNIAGGIVISVGDRKTRKKDVIKRLSRQALTEEAMRKVKPDIAMNNLKSKKEEDPPQLIEERLDKPLSERSSTKSENEIARSEHDAEKPA